MINIDELILSADMLDSPTGPIAFSRSHYLLGNVRDGWFQKALYGDLLLQWEVVYLRTNHLQKATKIMIK